MGDNNSIIDRDIPLSARFGPWTKFGLVVAFMAFGIFFNTRAFAAVDFVTPAEGEVLASGSVDIEWTPTTGVDNYAVLIGTAAGLGDVYDSTSSLPDYRETSLGVDGLPTDGQPLFITVLSRLWILGWEEDSVQVEAFNASTGGGAGGGTTGGGSGATDYSGLIMAVEGTNELATMLLETLMIGFACFSFFVGWRLGDSR